MKPSATTFILFFRQLFLLKIKKNILVFIFLTCIGMGLHAQDELRSARIEGEGMDEYGAYVDIYLPVSNVQGIDRWVNTGHLFANNNFSGDYWSVSAENRTISFSLRGTMFVGMRLRAYNTGGWSAFFTDQNEHHVSDDGDVAEAVVRLYLSQAQLDQGLSFKVTGNIDGNSGAGVGYKGGFDYELGSRTIAHPVLDATLTADVSATAGNMSVAYRYTGMIGGNFGGDYTITHWLDNNTGATVTDNTNNNASGSINTNRTNTVRNVTFRTRFAGKGGLVVYTKNQSVEMPAYQWPATLTPVYDDSSGIMTVSWTINALASSANYIKGDEFEVQRSLNANFPTNTTKTYTVAFDGATTNYSIEDDLKSENVQGTVYYRLRRTKTRGNWEWNTKVEASKAVNMKLLTALKTVPIALDTANARIIVKWGVSNGVWPAGTKFTIKRKEENNSTNYTEIVLTDIDLRKGEYIDENLSTCVDYSYSLLVQPGSTTYATPAAVNVDGKRKLIEIGTIESLLGSKGYFSDRVELQWISEGGFTQYVVLRSTTGNIANAVQIGTVQALSTARGLIQYEDTRALAGTYYTYFVRGVNSCGGSNGQTAALSVVGFKSPTGNIYGRITYENGQAVEGVGVRLQNNSSTLSGKSIMLTGNADSYLKLDSLYTPFSDTAFTVETWIKPGDAAPADQVLFSRNNQYELGFAANGQLYFSAYGNTVSAAYINTGNNYKHVAGSYNSDSLFLYINGEKVAAVKTGSLSPATPANIVYIGKQSAGKNYKGNIDELRLWNRVVPVAELQQNHTRMLVGNEPGMVAYWRFDETINNQFFDLSMQDGEYNRNDGNMNAAQVTRSTTIPTADQLALKGITDQSGNYMVSGIPYTDNGITYTIIPTLGTHQFDPTSVNRLMSANSNEFTVDFKDKSSFPVSGTIYYTNSTIPVKGVQFQINGQYAHQSNGQIIESDEFGKFTINVPVGTQEVKAVKPNHSFENGGKITDRFGANLNYQGPVSERILYDKTTVRFIGRVAGGSVQEGFALGHSLSKNNLGEKLSVTMELVGAQNRKINASETNTDSLAITNHLLPTNQQATQRKTNTHFKTYSIDIIPDPVTGEFVTDLIPENYNIMSVKATGHNDLMGNNPVNINLSDRFNLEKELYTYKDSVTVNGVTIPREYTDTVFYNGKYKFTYRYNPTIAVNQLDKRNDPAAYFGDTTIKTTFFNGTVNNINIVNPVNNAYLFGYPVFTQNVNYKFKIQAFEQYGFYKENDLQNPVAIDKVATTDGSVSVANDLRDGDTAPDTLSLNSEGIGIYSFAAGTPEMGDGVGRKGFSLSIKFGAQVLQWNNGNKQYAYILGGRKTGSDFVTAGPNEIIAVLRDPGGSNSASFFEAGTTITSTKEYNGGLVQAGNIDIISSLGSTSSSLIGVGVAIGTTIDVVNDNGGRISHQTSYTGSNAKTEVVRLLTRYETSSDPLYVGAAGDLFIGNSNNISYGNTINLIVVKNNEIKEGADIVYFDGRTENTEYSIVQRTGVDFSQKFATTFAYPQKHIETILLPNLTRGRNEILLPVTTNATDAQMKADNEKRLVYVSKLPATDPNYGASNGDTDVFGPDEINKTWDNGSSYKIYYPSDANLVISYTDTIRTINQYIKGWKKELANNEQTKIEAKDRDLVKNFSFTGGSSISSSHEYNTSTTKVNSFEFVVGGSFLKETGILINGTGIVVRVDESVSTNQGGTFTTDNTNTKTFGFTLAEEGLDYLSIDVLKAPDSSFVFKTKGGVTQCPYEGATVSQYYQPGTIISQPTIQAQVPNITVEQAVVSNVPSSRKASYVIHMSNNTDNANSPGASFLIHLGDDTNPDGAKVYMDGTELGTGREIYVPYGSTITKTLTLEKGPNVMSHENLQVILESPCQWQIADSVSISAHFIPSCSDINIKSPVDKWIVNTNTPVDNNDNPYLAVTIDQFDQNTSLFDHIALQYKPASTATWITNMNFYSDQAKFDAAQGEKMMITQNGKIDYNFAMNTLAFADQNYEIRAVSYCMNNAQIIATTESNLITGIKDTYSPRLFGNPQPANSILGIDDDIRINFNEPIADGLLSYSDFQVTGVRNGTLGDHNVAVQLDGQNDYLVTEFNKNLAAKSLTIELWALPTAAANGTLFSHGNTAKALELALTSDNKLEVTVGTQTIVSPNPLNYRQGEWSHIAVALNAETKKLSAYYNFQEVIAGVEVNAYEETGLIQIGKSMRKPSGNYFNGKLHGVRIWSGVISSINLQQNSLKRLSGSESGLLTYYPMNEGKGTVVMDKARGINAKLEGSWSMPAGRAISLNGNAYVKANTSFAPVLKDMDYTMELWFKGEPGQSNATLLSSGKGNGSDLGGSEDLFTLGFEAGKLVFNNNSISIPVEGNYLDNNWHHLALAVNRNAGNGQVVIDGVLKRTFDPQGLGGIASAQVLMGARGWYSDPVTLEVDQHFKGYIDEVRLWNTYLSMPILEQNNNTALHGNEFGLLAYYPFEKYFTFQNNQELGFTLNDRKIQEVATVVVPDAVLSNAAEATETAPVKRLGAVENLQFDYVANNDAIILNMLEPRQAIDKTIVTFKAKNIRDKNGNTIKSPVTWSAYIDKNPLRWSDDVLNLSKKIYDNLAFEVVISNQSGLMQNYRLQNLPSWLTVSPASGTIGPKGNQKLVFTVNKGLNVGAYDETVYLLNDNQESAPLSINLKVNGVKPAWVVNPADYKYNMTVYGKIKTRGAFSSNPEDMLAAFVNGKCIGVTNSTYIAGNDNWYSLLTMYSNEVRKQNVEFRIWEAATGKTYLATPSVPVSFINDTIYGTVRNPIIFEGNETIFQNVALNKGWNWISFGLKSPALNSVNSTLASGNWAAGDIVKNEEIGFDSYSATEGWVGLLRQFNNTSLFMLKTANEQTLSVPGIVDTEKIHIPVKGGRWNYISYIPQTNINIKEALADYPATDDDVIKSQTGFAMYDSRNGWVGTLTYLEPGKGYMLYRKAANDVSFVYPTITGILTGYNRIRLNSLEAPVDNNYQYAENMTMVAVPDEQTQLLPGDKILAYAGTELRGQAGSVNNPVTGKPTLFINIAGSTAQQLHFALERNGQVIATAHDPVIYNANGYAGTIVNPYVLRFSSIAVTAEDKIYPTPFTNQVTVQVNMANETTAAGNTLQMLVHDAAGNLVYRGNKLTAVGHSYNLQWNGKDNNGLPAQSGVYIITVYVNEKARVYKTTKL